LKITDDYELVETTERDDGHSKPSAIKQNPKFVHAKRIREAEENSTSTSINTFNGGYSVTQNTEIYSAAPKPALKPVKEEKQWIVISPTNGDSPGKPRKSDDSFFGVNGSINRQSISPQKQHNPTGPAEYTAPEIV